MQTKVGYISSPSITGSQSYNIGFKPDFVVFYYSNIGDGLNEGFGIACNSATVKQQGRCSFSGDASTLQSSSSAIIQKGTIEATISGFTDSGFDVDWKTTEIGFEINYWAVSGVSFCDIVKVTAPTLPSTVSYTGFGFQPQALLAFSGASNSVAASHGFAISKFQQFAVGFSYPNPICFQEFGMLLKTYDNRSLDTCVSLETLDSDGFTLNWTEVSSDPQDIFVLALNGSYFDIGKDRLPSVIGEAMSSTNIQPNAIFISGASDDCLFLGTSNSIAEQRVSSVYLGDDSLNASVSGELLSQIEESSSFASTSVSFSASDATGYKINQTAKHLVDQEYFYFAISTSSRKSNSRLASRPDFERGDLYDNYRRYPFFAERAQAISQNCSGKILIVGCGWGFTVDECLSLGLDVWGCDASSYAIFKATQELSQSSFSRITVANCLSNEDLIAVKTLSGLAADAKFDWCVTDDMLSVLKDDSEVSQAISSLSLHSNNLLHFVTPSVSGSIQDIGLLWKSIDDWKTLVGTNVFLA